MSGPTTRSNRPRVAAAEGPLRGRSKQGCWTCRFRRKKCDEQQAGTGLCGNCSRLRIDCLGWGERRPEWSKDPAQLKAFKDAMKAKIHHHMRSSSDPLLSIAEPSQPATIEAPSSAYPSSSANLSQETITAPIPSLALSSSLVRQLSSNSVDPYNYRAFVEHVRILVAGANLPRSCGVAFEEIARLGEWKHGELDQGRLSYRELAKRALRIEETLQAGLEQHTIPPVSAGTVPFIQDDKEDMLRFINFSEDDESRTSHASSDVPPEFTVLATAPIMGTINPSTFKEKVPYSLGLLPEVKGSVVEPTVSMPHLTGLLFLHSIVSGLNQKVPEILSTSEQLIQLLMADERSGKLPKNQKLLAVALVGCLSDTDNELVSGLLASTLGSVNDNETAYNSAIALAHRTDPLGYVA